MRQQSCLGFALCMLSMSSCAKDATSLNGIWKLMSYEDFASGKIETEAADVKRSVVITFQDDGKDGTMKGHTVSNRVTGDYRIPEPGKLDVLSFGGTKVGERGLGKRFWKAISAASSFAFEGGDLVIYFNDDTEKMTFVSGE